MVDIGPGEALEGDVTKVLKKTRFGYLFQKDTWDLFGSLMITLKLVQHRKRMSLQKFNHCFLGNEAVKSLASLKFLCSPDTRDTFNLAPGIMPIVKLPESSALTLMQHFVDGSFIKDPTTKAETLIFDKQDIYTLTAKGLRVLEEFVQDFQLESEADHLIAALGTQPVPRPKLLRPTRQDDDELVITQTIVYRIFRQFVGRFPNYISIGWRDHTGVLLAPKDRSSKLLKALFKKDPRPLDGKVTSKPHCTEAPRIIHWLCGNTAISCPHEAAEMAAQFVRFGLIVLLALQTEKASEVTKFTATGSVPRGNTNVTTTADFLYSQRALYAITVEGSSVAGWSDNKDSSIDFIPDLALDTHNAPRVLEESVREEPVNKANAARLERSIKDPAWLILFREFLREQRCEYDLSFWLDVEDFKTEFEVAQIAAVASKTPENLPPIEGTSSTPLEPLLEPERPHEVLGNRPFLIYNTYLVPSSNCQLSFNIGTDLKEELQRALEHCVEHLTSQILITESSDPGATGSTALDIDQLAIIVWLYERVQNRVFCVLADDYIPRFMKWPKFIAARIEHKNSSSVEPGMVVPIFDKGKGKAKDGS